MAIYRFRPFTLTGSGNAEAVVAGAVGDGFFETLRATPLLGRVFLPEEDTPARGHVVILSDGFWKSHFGGTPDVDRPNADARRRGLHRSSASCRRDFRSRRGASRATIWVPVAYTDADRAVRDNHNDQVVARLKPGVNVAQAQSEMKDDLAAARARVSEGEHRVGRDGRTAAGADRRRHSDVAGHAARGGRLVLLIACANVGNLLFARALGRRKELAIRTALGAGRGRVFQQLLVEAIVLAFTGGVAGLLLARASLAAGARAARGSGSSRRRDLDRRTRAAVRVRRRRWSRESSRECCRRFAPAAPISTMR